MEIDGSSIRVYSTDSISSIAMRIFNPSTLSELEQLEKELEITKELAKNDIHHQDWNDDVKELEAKIKKLRDENILGRP